MSVSAMMKLFQPEKLGNVTNRVCTAIKFSTKQFGVKNFKQLNKSADNGAHISCLDFVLETSK